MKCLVLLLFVVAGASAMVSLQDMFREEFAQFKAEHKKRYSSLAEEMRRLSIYALNKYKIIRHNELFDKGEVSFKLKINKYSDMPNDEFLSRMTGLTYHVDYNNSSNRDYEVESASEFAILPKTVDWRTKGAVTEVKDQGQCGSCWAFSAVYIIVHNFERRASDYYGSWHYMDVRHDFRLVHVHFKTNSFGYSAEISEHCTEVLHGLSHDYNIIGKSETGALEGQKFLKTKNLTSLSEQNLVDCTRSYGCHGCQGGWMNSAFNYIKDNGGIATENSYPYQAVDAACRYNAYNRGATTTGYVVIAQNEDKLKEAVAKNGPIAVAIDASNSFQQYADGVYYDPNCSSTRLNHGVLVVGYGTDKTGGDYWLVKNSWSKSWGAGGYIKMARNRNNNCGIVTAASYPTV